MDETEKNKGWSGPVWQSPVIRKGFRQPRTSKHRNQDFGSKSWQFYKTQRNTSIFG